MSDTFGAGAAIQGAATLASTAMQISAANSARKTAIKTANQAAGTVTDAANTANDLYSPYATAGTNALNTMSNGMTQQFLEQTPGYQWNLSQGEQAATNSAAARGLADSGAALKGASTYASGLADSTYQNQWNDENTLANYGYNALNSEANNLTSAATNAAQIKMEGANGSMASTTSAANALSSGLNSIGNTASQYAAYNSLLGNSSNSDGIEEAGDIL